MAESRGEKSILQTTEDANEYTPNDLLSSENYLLELHCPFNWKECFDRFNEIDWRKELKYKLQKDSREWTVFCINILLGCVQSHLKDEEAATTFDDCEKILEENKGKKFFVDIKEGLEHVLLSCRLFFFRINREHEKAEEIRPRIKHFRSLSKESQAAVFALKAKILGYFGHDAKVEGFKFAKMAIELDPDDFGLRRGAWYYIAAKILAETRRSISFSQMPSDEELQLLERSVKIDPFLHNLVYLADSYREKAKAKGCYTHQHYAENKLWRAKEIYESCVHDEHASSDMLARCGMGLIKLPRQFRNYEVAENAFERAIQLGSRHATIGMGYLLSWNKHEYRKALEYFEKASSEGALKAGLEVVKMKFKIDDNYDLLEDCNKYIADLENMLEARQKRELTAAFRMLKVEYLLVKRKDLMAAIQEWKIAMDEQCDSKYMWESKCQLSYYRNNSKNKLCNLIYMKIKGALNSREISSVDKNFLLRVLEEFPSQSRKN